MTQTSGTEILITDATRAGLGEPFLLKALAPAKVKGKTQEIQIYSVSP